jgi:hypothetical protein
MCGLAVYPHLERTYMTAEGRSGSVKHSALIRKNKDRLTQSQENVPERGEMSIRGLWFQ